MRARTLLVRSVAKVTRCNLFLPTLTLRMQQIAKCPCRGGDIPVENSPTLLDAMKMRSNDMPNLARGTCKKVAALAKMRHSSRNHFQVCGDCRRERRVRHLTHMQNLSHSHETQNLPARIFAVPCRMHEHETRNLPARIFPYPVGCMN
jgi:hypothetical protein